MNRFEIQKPHEINFVNLGDVNYAVVSGQAAKVMTDSALFSLRDDQIIFNNDDGTERVFSLEKLAAGNYVERIPVIVIANHEFLKQVVQDFPSEDAAYLFLANLKRMGYAVTVKKK